MRLPMYEFDEAHTEAGGAKAPDGQILLWMQCGPEHCAEAITVTIRAYSRESKDWLEVASGTVHCTSELVQLALTMNTPWTQKGDTTVKASFHCSADNKSADGDEQRIFIRNNDSA